MIFELVKITYGLFCTNALFADLCDVVCFVFHLSCILTLAG